MRSPGIPRLSQGRDPPTPLETGACTAGRTQQPGASQPHAGIGAGAVGELAVLPRWGLSSRTCVIGCEVLSWGHSMTRSAAAMRAGVGPTPRLAARIGQALGAAETVVNVGAGAGSYEPLAGHVIAVEPSLTMIHQRPRGDARVVRASATHLPVKDAAFAAALAVLTVHHLPDRVRGLRELACVATDRVVVVTWDPAFSGFWLIDDYFPAIGALDRGLCPPIEELQRSLGGITIQPLPIPYDCTDGFLCAYWRRPHAYLRPEVEEYEGLASTPEPAWQQTFPLPPHDR